jgi:hypothetical protein
MKTLNAMKTSSSILTTILHRREFKKINSGYCYSKFISLLQPKFQKAIAFVYLKNSTLFIALSHPGFKMELSYNIEMLKSIFTMLVANDNRCHDLSVEKVVIFNSNKISIVKQNEVQEQTIPYYHEAATGSFAINCTAKELRERFQAIKESIACNLKQK